MGFPIAYLYGLPKVKGNLSDVFSVVLTPLLPGDLETWRRVFWAVSSRFYIGVVSEPPSWVGLPVEATECQRFPPVEGWSRTT